MNAYIVTVQIVGGILTPIVLLLLVSAAVQGLRAYRERIQYKQAELEKYRVFDSEAEFYGVPNPTMVGVRLKKGDKVVWQGGIGRKGLK